jgi:hypothetical protein
MVRSMRARVASLKQLASRDDWPVWDRGAATAAAPSGHSAPHAPAVLAGPASPAFHLPGHAALHGCALKPSPAPPAPAGHFPRACSPDALLRSSFPGAPYPDATLGLSSGVDSGGWSALSASSSDAPASKKLRALNSGSSGWTPPPLPPGFNYGDIVWAKAGTWPFWPAEVSLSQRAPGGMANDGPFKNVTVGGVHLSMTHSSKANGTPGASRVLPVAAWRCSSAAFTKRLFTLSEVLRSSEFTLFL